MVSRTREHPTPGSGSLATAAALAAVHALWTGFEWRELVVAREGGIPFCALGATDACTSLWDSSFARGIEAATGLPVAGWGAVWSLAALGLPLLALARVRAQRSPEPFWSATLLVAVAGVGSVALLAGVSVLAGTLCPNCAITYVLVLAYSGVALVRARSAPPRRLGAGVPVAAASVGVAFALLLYPGLRTPRGETPSAALLEGPPAAGPDEELVQRVRALSPQQKQYLSDARAAWLAADRVPLRPPRALYGSAMAPIRLTHFSDILCSHCARLHQEIERLLASAPANAVSIEYRKFPLDGDCNPLTPEALGHPIRCKAALAMICMEGKPGAFALEGELFAHQSELDEELLFALAEPYMPRVALESCIDAPETRAKLQDDIAWAAELGIEGTPLVLLNGRKTLTYFPFIYLMVMTGGDTDHPAFEGLPPPRVAPSLARAGRPD